MAVPFNKATMKSGAVVRGPVVMGSDCDLSSTPGLIDAKVGDDVLEPVAALEVSSRHWRSSKAAGDRGTEIEDAASTLLFERDRARQTVAELRGVGRHHMARVAGIGR